MKFHPPSFSKAPIKFRMPTADNLVPIRLDIELDGSRFKDAFAWNPNDPDSEVVNFARRTMKDLKLPPAFITQITQSIQTQLAEFRFYQGQDMQAKEKIVPLKLDLRVNNAVIRDQFLWDISNFENDPEEFAINFCKDLNIEDPEVAAVLVASDCNPRSLTKHIPILASSRNVPLIFVKDNKGSSLRLGELVKLKTAMAIGVKARGSNINTIVDELL